MDGKIKTLFLITCILAIIAVIIGSLVATTLFRYEGAKKNPYYWCDATWQCCATPDCATVSKGGKMILKDSSVIYSPSDLLKPGSAYHQNCILPVKNAMLNYAANPGTTQFDVSYLYPQTGGGGWAGSGTHPWGPGCTGPGGSGKCADPTYNPQVNPACPYFSTDAPNEAYSTITPDVYATTGYNLPNGKGATGNSFTLTPANWASTTANPNTGFKNLTAQIFTGQGVSTQSPYTANGYLCPFQGQVNKTTSTGANTGNNTLDSVGSS